MAKQQRFGTRWLVAGVLAGSAGLAAGCAELGGLWFLFLASRGQVTCWDGFIGARITAQFVDAQTGEPLANAPLRIDLGGPDWTRTMATSEYGAIHDAIGHPIGGCFVEGLPMPEVEYSLSLPPVQSFTIVVYPDDPNCTQEFVIDPNADDVIVTSQSQGARFIEITTPLAVQPCEAAAE